MKLSAILLAAGTSSRMGLDNKLLLPFGGKALLLHALDELLASSFLEIIVVTGFEASMIKSLVPANEKLKIVEHRHYSKGMTSSIQAGLRACSQDSRGFMICLGDMPFLKSFDYNRLLSAFEQEKTKQPIIAPLSEGKKRNPVLFDQTYKATLLAHQNPEGCKDIVQQNKSKLIYVPFENPSIFADIDTIKDYRSLTNGVKIIKITFDKTI